jgi:hypothetical protein
VTCPYAEPNCNSSAAPTSRHCACGRSLKRCSQCATSNRAFARFCRNCGIAIPTSQTDWPAYRGGSRRLGLNPTAPIPSYLTAAVPLTLRLGDACRSLLGQDGHLVAISVGGFVEVADAHAAKSLCRFQTQGPVTAEPCLHDGVLYLATRGQLTAYSLGAITMQTPRVRPLWHLPLNGTPIQALTAAGDCLYVTLASSEWREVVVVENLSHAQPAAPRSLHGAPRISWVAADPGTAQTVFLSETEDRGIQLHVARPELSTHPVPLDRLGEHPIALLGGSVFGIFGEAQRLYRISASSGALEEPLDEDTQLFALTQADGEWDRDSVRIDSEGVVFSRARVRDSFEPHDRAVKGSPLIVRDSAAVVAMEDGRVRIYNLSQLPRHEVWRVGDTDGVAITALAAFDSYVAAGNREGIVELRQLRSKGPAK